MLVLIITKYSREVIYRGEAIYRGVKSNVNNYGLKPFHNEYEHLVNEYWSLNIKALQGTIQPLTRSLFPLDLIKGGIVRKQKDFSLTNITGDSRLIALITEKTNEFYALSDFYK